MKLMELVLHVIPVTKLTGRYALRKFKVFLTQIAHNLSKESVQSVQKDSSSLIVVFVAWLILTARIMISSLVLVQDAIQVMLSHSVLVLNPPTILHFWILTVHLLMEISVLFALKTSTLDRIVSAQQLTLFAMDTTLKMELVQHVLSVMS